MFCTVSSILCLEIVICDSKSPENLTKIPRLNTRILVVSGVRPRFERFGWDMGELGKQFFFILPIITGNSANHQILGCPIFRKNHFEAWFGWENLYKNPGFEPNLGPWRNFFSHSRNKPIPNYCKVVQYPISIFAKYEYQIINHSYTENPLHGSLWTIPVNPLNCQWISTINPPFLSLGDPPYRFRPF